MPKAPGDCSGFETAGDGKVYRRYKVFFSSDEPLKKVSLEILAESKQDAFFELRRFAKRWSTKEIVDSMPESDNLIILDDREPFNAGEELRKLILAHPEDFEGIRKEIG